MPGLLERFGDHALMLGAGAGAVVGQNFGMGRHKAAQGLAVFIVYGADFVGTKIALLFFHWFAVSVSVVGSHRNKLSS